MFTNESYELLSKLRETETEDYQNRRGSYPSSDKPDTINLYHNSNYCETILTFSFKNTTQKTAEKFVIMFLENKGLSGYEKVSSYQDGDYENDWVIVDAKYILKRV